MKSVLQFVMLVLFVLGSPAFAQAQTAPLGTWKTIDDETGEAKAHVEITKTKEGKLQGKIIDLLQSPDDKICTECPGDKKGQKMVGMTILWELEPYDGYWSYGQILDPNTGKEYKCSLWVEDENTLKVRGYLGFSLLGRNQRWLRVK